MLMITTPKAVQHRETEMIGPESTRLDLLYASLMRTSATAALLQRRVLASLAPAVQPVPRYCLGDHVYGGDDPA